jgi:hypothetical protein
MWSEYDGDFGEDGFGDALADLNDAFGELDGFGAVEGTFKVAAPVIVGTGLTFGTAAALDYFISDAKTRESVLPYKWLIGAGVGTVAGLIMWKTKLGPTAGIVTVASSLALALASWGMAKLAEAPAETQSTSSTTQASQSSQSQPSAGYRAYVTAPAQPIYGGFGRYEIAKPEELYQLPTYSGLGEGSMVDLGVSPRSTVLQGAINPGVFG